ncbi:MAG TPA: cyclic pyranopterin monophosphate synthase MoaC [Hellea balneolensis]|uniref:Cyclic pyranopterin monophosphate synthase n=1 Tax=Hellea balneolensis TaxID=287478 RepID=A0A7C5LZU8_9PROT|nr:cyclic pyranopterin monophosphate synthase MoaC [Hellea balneolensis]
MGDKLTHFDAQGRVNMVDISDKNITTRIAKATGAIRMSALALDLVKSGKAKKGDVITIAEIAGVMATKKTSGLIPLCHPIALTGAKVEIEVDENLPGLKVVATTKTAGKTGVEMEALSAVAVACLTIYDMLKAVDKSMCILNIELLEKSGGKSGTYRK